SRSAVRPGGAGALHRRTPTDSCQSCRAVQRSGTMSAAAASSRYGRYLPTPAGLARDRPTALTVSSKACDPCIVIPGTLVEIAGVGVLLSGESGVGKSDTVLGLLDRGHRLIADDAVELYLCSGRLHGRSPEQLRGLVAIRGLG